ncbi:MAG TPA: 1-acyl-sn-glycerol-3-phosphate acyltransferase, partial [Ramlibacter sp.]|nr:1-acyl-sn-glycerol-3-phosphate acyltransferase [Ramlibacter sp.]
MNSLRAAWRLSRALLHALAGMATIVFAFPRMNEPQREASVQAWSLKMLALLGVHLELHGRPPRAGPVLLVANHISWLD